MSPPPPGRMTAILFPCRPLPAVRVNMSQQSCDLFIRLHGKTAYAFNIRDETQGWSARDGYTHEVSQEMLQGSLQ